MRRDQETPTLPRTSERSRFEPPPGKVLLILGQNVEEIHDYVAATPVLPGGFMAYTSLARLEGLRNSFNQGDGTQFADQLSRDYPQTTLQLGLYLVDDCKRISEGEWDVNINRLGVWLKGLNRPVFLRIGYEFDGPHNHYPPEDYVAAFRRIVDRLRKGAVRNAAFVWHSYASLISRPLGDWYPGDEYVDWVGLSYFTQRASELDPVVNFAHKRGKPVMIAEASPLKSEVPVGDAWPLWFGKAFQFIQDNRVSVFSFINSNWDVMKQFKNQHWGDTRVQTRPGTLKRWNAELAKDRYMMTSADLFKNLGYKVS